jgi:Predicted RNA-binding protein homologous to eukaryotic snRNP
MQPFDALSIRAVLHEAKPLLLNRKVDKISQLARDEVLISLRSKGGTINLFLSAQSVYGRLCLVRIPSGAESAERPQGDRSLTDRYQSKYSSGSPPNFCVVLRKHLTGATLVGVDQLPGERIVDFVFSCVDEVGKTSIKLLTAEIMGRHSNLIFWEKESGKILASSHSVTKDMSRQREVLPNLKYERPPGQDRPNIFSISKNDLSKTIEQLKELQKSGATLAPAAVGATGGAAVGAVAGTSSNAGSASSSTTGGTEGKASQHSPGDASPRSSSEAGAATEPPVVPVLVTLEQWLLATFTGLGKHLSEEIISATGLESCIEKSLAQSDFESKLWDKIEQLQNPKDYKPIYRVDLSRYTVLGWYSDCENEEAFKHSPSVNDLVEHYFRALEAREHFIQLREKIKSEIQTEHSKLATRHNIAKEHLSADEDLMKLKSCGDMILTNVKAIQPGQAELVLDDWTKENGDKITIELNPNLSSVQNAQTYYRKYAKQRARQGAAKATVDEVDRRMSFLDQLKSTVEGSKDILELRKVKEMLSGRKPQDRQNKGGGPGSNRGGQQQQNKPKHKSMSVTSSDGWTIYVGRNRMENDQLLNKLANPNDIWLHVLGQGGAHVLIRVPSSKQEPPKTTLIEAAHIAARLSKAAVGSKVRVVYTQCKYVKQASQKKPGLVAYENEKTIEIDTARPMPKLMKRLFS